MNREDIIRMARAIELALEALELYQSKSSVQMFDDAVKALREALAEQPAPVQEPSPTAGMNIAQRILHVGGRNNAAGYVEFGSTQAVEALVRQVLRDLPAPRVVDCHATGVCVQSGLRAEQPAQRKPLTDEFLRKLHHIDEFGLFCDYDDFEQIARAIEAAHGIGEKQDAA